MKADLCKNRVVISDHSSHRSFQTPPVPFSLCWPFSWNVAWNWRVLAKDAKSLALRWKGRELASHSVITYSVSWCWSPNPEGQCLQIFNRKQLEEPRDLLMAFSVGHRGIVCCENAQPWGYRRTDSGKVRMMTAGGFPGCSLFTFLGLDMVGSGHQIWPWCVL